MSKNSDNIFSNARSGGKSLTIGKIVRRLYVEKLRDGEPCDHVGCLSHLSHPCEGCGRIGGMRNKNLFIRDDIGEVWTFNGEYIHLAGDDEYGSGYECSSWEEAVRVLNVEGYISDKSPWIPVETEPAESGYYLIRHYEMRDGWSTTPVVDRCFFEKDPNFGWEEMYVTHWMPLPKTDIL